MRNGGYPERIGQGKVVKRLTDTEYGDEPVALQTSTLPTANDNTMIGTWDNTSGLVWWLYRDVDDAVDDNNEEWSNEHLIVYSPTEDRWSPNTFSLLNDEKEIGLDRVPRPENLTSIASLLNSGVDQSSLTRGVILFMKEDGATDEIWLTALRNTNRVESTVTTKRLSASSVQLQPNRRFAIIAIRPIIWGTPLSDFSPTVTLTINSFETPVTNTVEDTTIATDGNLGDDGWYELNPITCEYFDITMSYGANADAWASKDIAGFELRIDDGGEY